MTKCLDLIDVGQIIESAADGIDSRDQMQEFLEDLASVLTKRFGGKVSHYSVGGPYIYMDGDENVPEDGGVYKDVDKDTSIEDFMANV